MKNDSQGMLSLNPRNEDKSKIYPFKALSDFTCFHLWSCKRSVYQEHRCQLANKCAHNGGLEGICLSPVFLKFSQTHFVSFIFEK